MKRWACTLIAILFGCSFLLSQDLVEAAKKEKERRARLKKKSAHVVTNADLYNQERSATIQITPSKKETKNIPLTSPQKIQSSISATPIPPPKKMSPQQIDNIDQIDFRVDKSDQMDQAETQGFSREYATQIISYSESVQNPRSALDKPDGQYAELGEFGTLDLKIDIKNGSGDDIAIYARRQKQGIQLPTMNYGVFVEHDGEWEFIGFGGGERSPEKFDLGKIPSSDKIRILFKDFSQNMWTAKPYRQSDTGYFMEIDAVKSLHR